MTMMDVEMIEGGLHVDERGVVAFCNDFDVSQADRFYTVRSHCTNQIRGWVGHRVEQKWFIAFSGTIIIAVVQPDDWQSPSRDIVPKKFLLSCLKPSVLHVPPGHATASVMLTSNAHLGIFSTGKIKDAAGDDYRFDTRMWKIPGL